MRPVVLPHQASGSSSFYSSFSARLSIVFLSVSTTMWAYCGQMFCSLLHAQNQARDSYLCLRIQMLSGEGNGNPLQCSCLENPRDGEAWWAAVCGVAQSWTRLKRLSSSSSSSSSSVGEKLYFLRLNTRGRQITSLDLL